MRVRPIKSLISSPFIEMLYILDLTLEWFLQCDILCFFIFTAIKFVFNISRSWWPFQCLNPRQRYQARLLVEERGRHHDRGCQVNIRKTWMWTIVGSVCGCLCASTSLGYVMPFGYSNYFCIVMINMYNTFIGQEINLVNFAAASYVLSNTI